MLRAVNLHRRRTHPEFVPGCFGCKATTLSFGAVEGPTSELAKREKTLADDMAAYRRMRRNGYQPAHLGGSAVVEREARDPIEIEHPRLIGLPDEDRKHAAEAAQVARDIPDILKRGPE